jgi:hypothetical protein
LAPGVIERIIDVNKIINLNKEEIKRLFIEYNSRIEKCLKTPLSPVDSWAILENELFNKKS